MKAKLKSRKSFGALVAAIALTLTTLTALTAVQIAIPQKADAATTVDMAGQNLQLRANLAYCLSGCTAISPTSAAISAISYSAGTITYTETTSAITALSVYQGIVITGTAAQMSACPEAFGPKQIMTKPSGGRTFTVQQTISGSCTTTAATSSYYAAPDGSANGSKVLYEYVGLINGVAIDAVVTTLLDANVTTTYDPATSTNANSATDQSNDGYFYQTLAGNVTVDSSGAAFKFDFYLHGTPSIAGGVVSGTALTLQNISVTSIDVDNGNQYTDFSGFQSYKLSSVSSSITAISSQGTASGSVTAASNTSGSGSNRTYTFTVANSFSAGDVVTITGASTSAYNKTYTVATASSTQFTATGQSSLGTWSGTATATRPASVTYTSSNSFAAGDTVTVSGASTAGYNGTFTVASATSSSFTVAMSVSGTTSTATATSENSHLKWTVSPSSSPVLINTTPKTVRFISCPTCTNLTNDDRDAVETVYTSVSSVTVKIGQTGTGSIVGAYGILFGPRLWAGSASKTYSNAFNTPPTSANTSVTFPSNTNTFLTQVNLGQAGFSDADANPFSGVKITTLPSSGTLEWYNGTGWQAVTLNQAITASDIENNMVRFNGSANTTLQFKVFDGLDYSTLAYTLTITVSGESQTISVTDPGGKHPGDTATIASTATSGLQVVATSSTTSICTVSSNLTVSFIAAGTCQLAFNQAGGTTGGHTYSPAATVYLTIVVSTLATQNITFVNPGDQVVSTFPTTIASNAVSKDSSSSATGLSINLATFTPSVCSVNANGTSIDLLKLGQCTITASQGGGTSGAVTYAAASNVTQTFQITNPLPRPAAPTGSGASSSSITVTFTPNGSAAKSICKVYSASGAIVKTVDPCTSGVTVTGLSSGGPFKVSITSVGNGTTNSDSPEGTLSASIATLSPSLSPSPQTVSGTKGAAISSTTAYTPTNFTTSPTYTIAGGTLPAGLSFSASTGVLSGTPTATLSSTTFTVTGGNGTETATASIVLSVVNPVYTVTYDSRGGSAISPSSVSWTYGTSLDLPAGPTLQGYNFAGWYDAATGGNLVGSGSTTVTPANNSSFTLYAQWTPKSNAIAYHNGGATSGTAPSTPTSVNSGATFTVPSNSYIYPGHSFAGWSNGSATYLAGASYPASGSINADVSLTALWTLDTITVTFDPNTSAGGSGTLASQIMYYDSGTVLTDEGTSTFANGGKNFIGWNTNPLATTALYPNQATVNLKASTTLYAIWSALLPWVIHPADQTYLLGGTVPNFLTGIQVTPTAGLAAGQSISCSVYALSDSTFSTPLTVNASLAIGTYNISCTGTAAAGYAAATINLGTLTVDSPNRSITYLGNLNTAGSAPGATVVTTGSVTTVSDKGSLVRTSFIFTGWNTASDGSGTSYSVGATPTLANNLTLYAQWEQSSFHGVAKSDLVSLGTSTTALGISIDTTWTNSGSSVRAQIPADSFPVNTTLNYYLVNTLSYANSLIGTSSHYVLDLLLTWLASDFTVPDANLSKPIRVTISNSSIHANADMYVIIGGSPTLLSTDVSTLSTNGARIVSVTNGQAIIEVIRDPQLVVKNLTYTVTYSDSYKASGSVPTDANSYLGNASATIVGNTGTLARPGYAFAGWCDAVVTLGSACSGHTYQDGDNLNLADANVTLRAIWTANTLAITYDSNGGDAAVGGSLSTSTGGTISSLATTSQAGYTFNGWFTDRFTGTQISTSAPHGQTSNFTLYAQWTPLGSSSIVFNANGGDGTMATQTDHMPRSITPNSYIRNGYTFREWNTNSGGSGSTYADGAIYNFTTGVTLFAMWNGNVLNISYDANGGSAPIGGDTSTVSGGTLISLPTSSLSGYTLDGWYTDSTTGTAVTTSAPHGQIADFILYAHWTVPSSGGGGGSGGGYIAPAPVATPPVKPEEKKETPEQTRFITPTIIKPPAPLSMPVTTAPTSIPAAPLNKAIVPVEVKDAQVLAFPSETVTIRQVAVLPSAVNNGIEMSGDNWSIAVTSTTQLVQASGNQSSNQVAIEAGNSVTTFGRGFKPNSQVDVFVYSTPIWLGSTITDAQGNYSVTLPMPQSLEVGSHTFQAVGVTADNVPRTANVPITLLPATTKTLHKHVDIYYAMDSFFLDKNARAQLTSLYRSVSTRLSKTSQVTVDIVGWVQPTKISPNVNYLSTGRAVAVMKFLKSLGLKASYALNTPGHDKENISTARRASITVVWTNPAS